jgi:DNA-binding FrmR family transcriptional regulator
MERYAGTDEIAKIINRLRRVEGQARGLQRMLEQGRTCEEVFTQLSATKAALDRVGTLLISMKMRENLADEFGIELSDSATNKALESFIKYSQCVNCVVRDGSGDTAVRP